jgi:hypothetical protein
MEEVICISLIIASMAIIMGIVVLGFKGYFTKKRRNK